MGWHEAYRWMMDKFLNQFIVHSYVILSCMLVILANHEGLSFSFIVWQYTTKPHYLVECFRRNWHIISLFFTSRHSMLKSTQVQSDIEVVRITVASPRRTAKMLQRCGCDVFENMVSCLNDRRPSLFLLAKYCLSIHLISYVLFILWWFLFNMSRPL